MLWTPLDHLKYRHYWSMKDGAVYFSGTGTAKKLRACDVGSFEVFNNAGSLLCRDRNHVYHGNTLISAIDRDSFVHVGGNYWRDQNTVYCEHETSVKPLQGCDAASFRFVGADYAADDFHAYYAGRKLKSNQPRHLRLLSDVYASDDGNVFFDGAVLHGADPATWQRIANGGFSRDCNNVFFGARKLPRVDLSTWKIITRVFSKDCKRVYYMNHVLTGEDPAEWNIDKAARCEAEQKQQRTRRIPSA